MMMKGVQMEPKWEVNRKKNIKGETKTTRTNAKRLNKKPSIMSPIIRFKIGFQLLDFNVLPINDSIVFSLNKIEVNTSARFLKKKKSQKN